MHKEWVILGTVIADGFYYFYYIADKKEHYTKRKILKYISGRKYIKFNGSYYDIDNFKVLNKYNEQINKKFSLGGI